MKRKDLEMTARRNHILMWAKKLFIENGYDKVKMGDIARASEFARRTLYLYFNGKQDILVEITNAEFASYEEKFNLIPNGNTSIYEQMRNFGSSYYEIFLDKPYLYRFSQFYDIAVHNNYEALSETTKNILKQSHNFMENTLRIIFEKGLIEKNINVKTDPFLASQFFLKCLYGIVHQYILHPKFPKECFYTELEYLIRGFII